MFTFSKTFRVDVNVSCPADALRTIRLGTTAITFQGVLHVQATLPDDKTLPFVGPKTGLDARGNPTTLTGSVKVTVSDATILTLTQPDPTTPDDPFSGTVSAAGPLGTAQLKFEDDTDGNQPLIALVDVEVVAGSTVSLGAPTIGPLRDSAPPAPKPGP